MLDKKNKNLSSQKKQSGISLIEIMIALVIGLILIAGIAQIYISNKQAYRLQESISYVNNNARFALFFLQEAVTAAGYKGNPAEADEDAFPATAAGAGCNNFNKGQSITGGAAATDLFCVKMKSPVYTAGAADIAAMTDCVGNAVAENVTVTTHFFISPLGELSCDTSHSDGTVGAPQPLVSDVAITLADIQLGIDSDGDKVVDNYDNAIGNYDISAAGATTTDWEKVIAVNISINLSSDADTTGSNVTTDGGLLQRTVTQTIALRSKTNPLP